MTDDLRAKIDGRIMSAPILPGLFSPEVLPMTPWTGRSDATRATSKAAAKAVANPENLRLRVYLTISAYSDGLTDEQQQALTGMSGNTQRPRRRELEAAGLIVQRGTRSTASGRQAVVWVKA